MSDGNALEMFPAVLFFDAICKVFSFTDSILFYFPDCPGTESENAGKSSACQGCPNQQICASSKPKGPDPGIICTFFCLMSGSVADTVSILTKVNLVR